MIKYLPVLLLSALLLTGCGSQGAGSGPTVRTGTGQIRTAGPRVAGAGDTFAGVVWTGPVRSVGGAWRVPAIRAGSQPGRAATWIGAQSIAPTGSEPFIQIGTREELQPVSASAPGTGRGKLLYEAFWTDVARGLHPVSLFGVHPGDAIAAAMALAGGHWTLTITDRTSGQSRRVNTAQEGAGRFGLALWLQEDPTRSANNRVFAYPDIAPLHVSALTVNAARPASRRLASTWMALPHAYLAPTAPTRAGFSVVPRTLSGAGAAYLRIAGPTNTQLNRYLARAATWRAKTPQWVITAATNRLIAALALNVRRLEARRWPGSAAADIRRLERAYATEVTGLRRALVAGPGALLAAFSGAGGGVGHAALVSQIRRDLGVRQASY